MLVDRIDAVEEAVDADAQDGRTKRTAAGRLLALLDAFTNAGGALTLSELSRYAGLSLTTTHRLVREVLAWGGLQVDDHGRYRLSSKFVELVSASNEGMRLREAALPHLMELHRRIGRTTVHLAIREGASMMYLDALRSYPNYTGESRMGGHLPLHATAAGMVLLAHTSEDFIEEYLSTPLQRFTPYTVVDPVELQDLLATIRAERYFVYPRSMVMDGGGIAAAIVEDGSAVKAVVNAVWLIDQQDPERLTPLVRATANRISRILAGPRPPLHPRTIDFNRRRAGLI